MEYAQQATQFIVNPNQFPGAALQANAAEAFQPNRGWMHESAP
jgi:hypothetical protein